jgi:hypothetical protein
MLTAVGMPCVGTHVAFRGLFARRTAERLLLKHGFESSHPSFLCVSLQVSETEVFELRGHRNFSLFVHFVLCLLCVAATYVLNEY